MSDFNGLQTEPSVLAHLWLVATTKWHVALMFFAGVICLVLAVFYAWAGLKRYRRATDFHGRVEAYRKGHLSDTRSRGARDRL